MNTTEATTAAPLVSVYVGRGAAVHLAEPSGVVYCGSVRMGRSGWAYNTRTTAPVTCRKCLAKINA